MDYSQLSYNPLVESIVEILRTKTQNSNPTFFRLQTNYFLSLVPSMLDIKINSPITGEIPINIYAISTAVSGSGKGFSTNLLEEQVINEFREHFMYEVFPKHAQSKLDLEAIKRAQYLGISQQEAEERLQKEFKSYGAYMFALAEATSPAIKQMRNKIILAKAGCINMIVDECYLPETEILTPTGWKAFKDCNGTETIAQFDAETKEISFVKPNRFISKDYKGDMYHFHSKKSFDFHITSGHEMLIYSSNTKKPAKKFPSEVTTGYSINTTGFSSINSNSTLTDQLRLAIAIQADGTLRYDGKCAEIGFMKQRKINEFSNLLQRLGIVATSRVDSRGYKIWNLKKEHLLGIKLSKNLNEILPPLDLVSRQFAKDVLDEIIKWDGSIQKDKPYLQRYTNKYKHNVDIVCAYAVLAGYKAKVYSNKKQGYTGGYYCHWNTQHSGLHQLNKLNGDSFTEPQREKYSYEGKVYCFTVPKGNLVLRHNNIVFMGSNCGFNFDKVIDALKDFLELYDKGLIKNKLTKNTDTSTRFQELVGKTPTNLLMFGTPSKLLDGGATEDKFFEFLESGYARRSFFASAPKESSVVDFTPEELYKRLTASNQEQEIKKISRKLLALCQPQLIGSIIEVPESVGIELLKYRIDCENRAKELPDHKEVYRAELSHRYFKALKLAGAYCFLRGSLQMSIDDLHQAIRFAEDSGEALRQMLEREKPYERLAKYIGSLNGKEITQVDLTTNLPFYKGSNVSKNEMMNMAIAYGYINNILIKKTFRDGVELFTGESLQETNLEKIICAYSDDFANGYENVEVDWFKDFDTLLPEAGFNWTNHHCIDGHRAEKDMIEGFNCIVLDVDGGISLQTVQTLLKDYEYIIHTTKRHQVTDEHGNCNDRFRIIIPTNYVLKLDSDDFKQFMKNVAQWCPFELDEQTFQRSRKWACYEHTTILKNNGKLFDVLPFIPRTSREAEYKKSQVTLQNLNAIERWFANRMVNGDRNNTLAKYGFMLLDNGFTPVEILDKLTQFNSKLDNPLDVSEIETTIIQSINNRYKEM